MNRGEIVLILVILLLQWVAAPGLAGDMGMIPEGKASEDTEEAAGYRIPETGQSLPPVISAMIMVLSAYLIGIWYEKWHMRRNR